MGATAAGKPGTNWKQVGAGEKKKLAPLMRHYAKNPHPFTACVRDNTKRFGPDRAKRICAVVKDLIEKRTTWRKGPKKKVMETPADYEAFVAEAWDTEVAPALEEAEITAAELADFSQMATDAGVLEAVEIDDPARIVEAAKATPMSHVKRGRGESLHDWGVRLKAGDRALEKKTRGGKDAAFEKAHPRKRDGEWRVKLGETTVTVKQGKKGNLVGTGDGAKIRAFQKKHGLKVDGVIGTQTATAMLGDVKKARKTAPGKIGEGQRRRLTGRGKRIREAPALAEVTFKPSELVEASSAVVAQQ